VSIEVNDLEVAAVQVDITFDASTPVDHRTNGRPDCLVNPQINKDGTSFTFQPVGCTPAVDCTSIRAVVIALDNSTPIADGATLFTCSASIARTAAIGSHLLFCTAPQASDPGGEPLLVTCSGGAILVTKPCPGDCDGNGAVTIDELITGVNIALGITPLSQCPALDANFNFALTVDELVRAVNNALSGCPSSE
jgi:hypothetical protein